jgi:hypothetical protein
MTISLPSASVRKSGRKAMGSNTQGNLLIGHTRGSMVIKIDINHLNEPFLASLRPGDNVDVELVITKTASAPVSQPHLPVR